MTISRFNDSWMTVPQETGLNAGQGRHAPRVLGIRSPYLPRIVSFPVALN
jgi:hypothetical protein